MHKEVLEEADPEDYDLGDYFLQRLVDLLKIGERGCTPDGCSDCV